MSKLGSKGNPARVRVQTEERAYEILDYCNSKEWQVIVSVEPDLEEDITDVERLMNPPQPRVAEKVDRNAPCPCGSGKKAKKCCYSN